MQRYYVTLYSLLFFINKFCSTLFNPFLLFYTLLYLILQLFTLFRPSSFSLSSSSSSSPSSSSPECFDGSSFRHLGVDEAICSLNSACIHFHFLCDGKKDCPDGLVQRHKYDVKLVHSKPDFGDFKRLTVFILYKRDYLIANHSTTVKVSRGISRDYPIYAGFSYSQFT